MTVESLKDKIETMRLAKSAGILSIPGNYNLMAFEMLLERLQEEEKALKLAEGDG